MAWRSSESFQVVCLNYELEDSSSSSGVISMAWELRLIVRSFLGANSVWQVSLAVTGIIKEARAPRESRDLAPADDISSGSEASVI